MSILASYIGGQMSAKQNALAQMVPQLGQMAQNPMAALGGMMPGGSGEQNEDGGGVAGQGAGGELPELMAIAAQNLGMNENDQNAALKDFLETGGVNLDPATTAWCAAFVNATLKQGGMEGTGSNLARSFENWGEGVDEPQRGDLAVFWRESPESGKGHVGFFDGYNDDGTIRVLGGNQGKAGEVSYSNYGTDKLIGFRRAPSNPMQQMAGL